MISRFLKLFIAIIFLLLVVTTLSLVDSSPRAFIDPWTDKLWGASDHAPEVSIPKPGSGNAVNHDGAHGGGKDAGVHFEEQKEEEASHGAQNDSDTHEAEEDKGDMSGPGKVLDGGKGGVIMEKLGNATAKAALGRATWKLLHTMTLRYPESPTQDERDALSAYFHLSARLYPCGECAAEFQALLRKYPPQTSSRRNAALWLCMLHNQVNARLKKAEFDCAHLDDEYDCGCGDAPIGKVDGDEAAGKEGSGQDDLGAWVKGG